VPRRTGDEAGSRETQDRVAEIVHDLRQPISTIRALVGSLRASESLTENMRWHLDHIEEQADELGGLVRALLPAVAGARLTLDAPGDRVCVEARSAVAAVVRSFAPTWSGQLRMSFTEPSVVAASPDLLRRAVRNVLDNAGRAAGPEGHISVSVVPAAAGTSIVVEDDGLGFGSVAPQHSLGLRIVERILSEGSGSLEIGTSAALGGARVALILPRYDEG
jgi:signal transduction histidine kinase